MAVVSFQRSLCRRALSQSAVPTSSTRWTLCPGRALRGYGATRSTRTRHPGILPPTSLGLRVHGGQVQHAHLGCCATVVDTPAIFHMHSPRATGAI